LKWFAGVSSLKERGIRRLRGAAGRVDSVFMQLLYLEYGKSKSPSDPILGPGALLTGVSCSFGGSYAVQSNNHEAAASIPAERRFEYMKTKLVTVTLALLAVSTAYSVKADAPLYYVPTTTVTTTTTTYQSGSVPTTVVTSQPVTTTTAPVHVQTVAAAPSVPQTVVVQQPAVVYAPAPAVYVPPISIGFGFGFGHYWGHSHYGHGYYGHGAHYGGHYHR
jgi:hypothetical protein